MGLQRVLRHLVTTIWSVKRTFPARTLEAIERAIGETEARHNGQIRFAVEHALDFPRLISGVSARADSAPRRASASSTERTFPAP